MFTKFSKNSLATAVVSALLISACGESTSSKAGDGFGNQPPPIDTGFNEADLVADLVDNVITPTYQAFASKSQQQATDVLGYCELEKQYAEGNTDLDNVTTAKNTAQQSWRSTMQTWQQAEVMQLGPLLENDGLLKNNIYSWPFVNTCSVDFDVVLFKDGEVNGQPYDISKRTPTRRGMAALEYLLFNADLADSCESGSPDNWNNQTASYRKVARCEFAVEVANDIHNSANTLTTRWLSSDGYANQLKLAGTTSSSIESVHDAVNRISDAMFFIDSKTKDEKLAEPLGYVLNSCGSAVCPEAVESLHARASIDHVTQNLIAFQTLLKGTDGVSFLDFLRESEAADLATSMNADVGAAIAQTESYTTTLADALLTDEAKVQETHANVKKVTDQLKTDFINSLALELPKTAAGDND